MENYEKAIRLDEIMQYMNNEYAYDAWVSIWPDGCTKDEAKEYFNSDEDYKELEDVFIKLYKAYHDNGLYDAIDRIWDMALVWDHKLGLKNIDNYV